MLFVCAHVCEVGVHRLCSGDVEDVVFASAIARLRLIGVIEGTSYLLLTGVGMPLKYLAHIPDAVRPLGMLHGILFILFCFALLQALLEKRLSFGQSVGVFIASLLPFGTYLIDGRLKRLDVAPESKT